MIKKQNTGVLQTPLPGINDKEGEKLPENIPPVVDAHVHIFPEGIFKSIWNWFDQYAWPIRYRLRSHEVVSFLLSKGICHVVALQYAHKPGMAEELNRYMVALCDRFPNRLTGMATVFPGEGGSDRILKKAFDAGLAGVKLHAHVQCFDMNGPEMSPIYETCQAYGKPVVMHVGREPKSSAYRCDPYEICSAEKLELVVAGYPDLKICVPHLGIDEFTSYQRLIERYDNLWLDTTMALADYFPGQDPPALGDMRPDRIMYGSDFPSIPYAWDREINTLLRTVLAEETLERVLSKNAIDFFSIQA
jgi:uncharacterized protein